MYTKAQGVGGHSDMSGPLRWTEGGPQTALTAHAARLGVAYEGQGSALPLRTNVDGRGLAGQRPEGGEYQVVRPLATNQAPVVVIGAKGDAARSLVEAHERALPGRWDGDRGHQLAILGEGHQPPVQDYLEVVPLGGDLQGVECLVVKRRRFAVGAKQQALSKGFAAGYT